MGFLWNFKWLNIDKYWIKLGWWIGLMNWFLLLLFVWRCIPALLHLVVGRADPALLALTGDEGPDTGGRRGVVRPDAELVLPSQGRSQQRREQWQNRAVRSNPRPQPRSQGAGRGGWLTLSDPSNPTNPAFLLFLKLDWANRTISLPTLLISAKASLSSVLASHICIFHIFDQLSSRNRYGLLLAIKHNITTQQQKKIYTSTIYLPKKFSFATAYRYWFYDFLNIFLYTYIHI